MTACAAPHRRRRGLLLICACGLLLVLLSGALALHGALSLGTAVDTSPGLAATLASAQWQQRPGGAIPLRLSFTDENGRRTVLRRYFQPRRPVALVLMYLSCSRLCPLTLSLTRQAFDRAGLVPDHDFELLAVSIDPYDGVATAAARKRALVTDPRWQQGLHLLTAARADQGRVHPAAAQLASAVGFGYLYDAAGHQYAHPAGWVLLDPDGHISRYFFGLQYDPATLRAAVQSAAARAPSVWTRPLQLLCDCLIDLTGRYDARVLRLLQILCGTLVAASAWTLLRLLRTEGPA